MHHKNIKLAVRKQLKKQFPDWKRLSRKVKKELARKKIKRGNYGDSIHIFASSHPSASSTHGKNSTLYKPWHSTSYHPARQSSPAKFFRLLVPNCFKWAKGYCPNAYPMLCLNRGGHSPC
jgi:hypothetical protein